MICTTLNRIRAHGPCEGGWKRLLRERVAELEKENSRDS